MVFKFKNFFDPPIYKGKTSFAPPPLPFATPPPHK
jgi:hypothetical protein